MRKLAVLDPALARRYTALVAAVASDVERRLSPSVLANRVAECSADPPTLQLASWRNERAAFAAGLRRLGRRSPCLVFADVRDCYGSIAPGVVAASLLGLGCEPRSARAVVALLEGLAEPGGRGLPVGPAASSVLANAVLARVDEALARAGASHLRWVDDVVVSARGQRDAERRLELLRGVLAGLGLELNESKTRIVLGPSETRCEATVSMARTRAVLG